MMQEEITKYLHYLHHPYQKRSCTWNTYQIFTVETGTTYYDINTNQINSTFWALKPKTVIDLAHSLS